MKVTVVSATPKQLDSVGAWQTMMPRSVAASVSTSSTPTEYLATMRKRCEACMTRRLTGVCRIEVPMRATASRAASTMASSCSPRGSCQSRSPNTISQPSPSIALTVSGGSSRGAKTRTFGLDMTTPWLAWPRRRCGKGSGAGTSGMASVELDAAFLEEGHPAIGFLAEKGVQLLGRARDRVDPGLLQFVIDRRVGKHGRDLVLDLVDDR